MSTLFSGIELSLRALLAQQYAIDVTNHNVANASTPGYSRQGVIMVPAMPWPPISMHPPGVRGQFGSGVLILGVRRFTDAFLLGRLRAAQSLLSQSTVERDALREIQGALNEPGENGIAAALDAFWDAWQGLTTDPASLALRSTVREAGERLASLFNTRAGQLTQLRRDLNGQISANVERINALASQVADLNRQIVAQLGLGNQPNDLMDQRDQVINEIAELTGAFVAVQSDGSVTLSIGGHTLVAGYTAFTLQAQPDPANSNLVSVTWTDNGSAVSFREGEMRGLLESRDTTIPAQLAELDTLAAELIARVNAQHRLGYGLNNATGLDFFSGTSAATMSLSAALSDLSNIAAASAPDSPGDGSNALALAQLRTAQVMNGGTATFNEFYGAFVATIGNLVDDADAQVNDYQLLTDYLTGQQQSVSGVSLDEEAANLVKYQRAYEAAARVLTALDEMADTIINRMGLVGR